MQLSSDSMSKMLGGPKGAMRILALQICILPLMLIDWRLPAAMTIGVIALIFALRWPLGAVMLLISTRLIGTASMSFLHIGTIHLGIFEPALLLCICTLGYHAAVKKKNIVKDFPWLSPVVFLLFYQLLSTLWCHKLGQGLQDIIATGVILANALLIMCFVESYDDFKKVFTVWVGACVAIGLISLTTSFDSGGSGATWEVAAGGGRETGLGQQPNWFAMNLMFCVHTCFGMAIIQKNKKHRWAFILAGIFIFLTQLRSGSRGGAYAIVIGGVLVALAHPAFRRWMKRFVVVVAGMFIFYTLIDVGSTTSKALTRIAINVTNTWGQDVRETNWLVCLQMFIDTWGFGIGPGGYADLLEHYNWKLYTSIHRYPHGIFWGVMAHYGLPGLILLGWLVLTVFRMARELISLSRGTAIEVFAWTMPATMVGYFAWSFVEFEIDDKPFWEFLSLYTALYLITRRMAEDGSAFPLIPVRLRRRRRRRSRRRVSLEASQ